MLLISLKKTDVDLSYIPSYWKDSSNVLQSNFYKENNVGGIKFDFTK